VVLSTLGPLGQISLLCVLIQYNIYLLQLVLHPVAVVFTLIHKRQEQNIHKEKEWITIYSIVSHSVIIQVECVFDRKHCDNRTTVRQLTDSLSIGH